MCAVRPARALGPWILALFVVPAAALAAEEGRSGAAQTAENPTAPAGPAAPPASPGKVDDLLNLDLDQLAKVRVAPTPQAPSLSAPANQIDSGSIDFNNAGTTGELAREAPSVSTRKTSALNLDPQVRGYNSGQLNTSANGMSEVKTRLDIDSALSQIDPGVVGGITVIDGPYTSLYGPGFAFLAADLLPPPRYANGPEFHSDTSFLYGSNAQTLYARENVLGGGRDWGVLYSYGLRDGNEYLSGGAHPDRVPAAYRKWDDLFTLSKDLSPTARIEFDYVRCEMNGVQLPGVVYDLDNSTNNQFNLRYIQQEDPKGPKQLELQAWYQRTDYLGDSAQPSKQDFYYQFFTLPPSTQPPPAGGVPVETIGQGYSDSVGVRVLSTFGERDWVQWTIGADWRRTEQRYREQSIDASGAIVLSGGDVYGIPKSRMDDVGLLTDLTLPCSDEVSVNVGGRLDYCRAAMDSQDPVVTQFSDPTQYYYTPGFAEPQDLLGMAYVTGKVKLTDQCTFNSGAAFAMRMPELAELYSDDPFVPIARVGNSYISGFSGLAPEKDFQLDAGFTTREKTLTYGARGFCAMIWDYIEPAPAFIDPSAPPGLATHVLGRNFQDFPPMWRTDLGTASENADTDQAGFQYVNEEFVTLAGGDLFAEARLQDWLSVSGSMAYVCGTNWHPVAFVSAPSWSAADGKTTPLGHSEGLPNIYPLTGTVAIRVFEPKTRKWMVEFSTRIVTAQDYVATSISELPSPGFATFALRGHYRVSEHLRVNLALENLFNQPYSEPGSLVIVNSQGVPTFVKEPGFSALLGMEAHF